MWLQQTTVPEQNPSKIKKTIAHVLPTKTADIVHLDYNK